MYFEMILLHRTRGIKIVGRFLCMYFCTKLHIGFIEAIKQSKVKNWNKLLKISIEPKYYSFMSFFFHFQCLRDRTDDSSVNCHRKKNGQFGNQAHVTSLDNPNCPFDQESMWAKNVEICKPTIEYLHSCICIDWGKQIFTMKLTR